jgi:hypothetical protein
VTHYSKSQIQIPMNVFTKLTAYCFIAFFPVLSVSRVNAQTYRAGIDSIGHQLVMKSPIDPWNSGPQDSLYELVSFPDDYAANPTKNYPVIFFFHGIGQEGPADGSLLANLDQDALPMFISQGLKPTATVGGTTYKFIVVSPQYVGGSVSYPQFYYIVPDILKKLRIDQTRMYITGLSYGGYGTYSCLTDLTDSTFIKKFAAIMPQSSVLLEGVRLPLLSRAARDTLPVLASAGSLEGAGLTGNESYVDSINAHNPVVPALFVERNGFGHEGGSWDSLYSPTFRPTQTGNRNGFEWMIQYTTKRVGSTAPVVTGTPSANAGAAQTITLPTNSVTLTGSGSETNGTIVSYAWSQLSGPSVAANTPVGQSGMQVSGLVKGTYVFQLKVTDKNNVTATATVTVTVNAAAVVAGAPVANAGANQTITLPTNSATLTGSGSETNGTIVSYAWTQMAGPSVAANTPVGQSGMKVSGLVQGTYKFQLKVTDNSGVSATAAVAVTVNSASVVLSDPGSPVANAGANQTITLPTNSVTLTGSGSETNGTIVSYAWSQVGGPSIAANTPVGQTGMALSGLEQGTYKFELKVTDNSGVSATATVAVTVNAAPVVPGSPVANAGANQTITLPTNSITLTGSGSETNGTIVSYAWSQVGGPSIATNAPVGQSGMALSGLEQGTYKFELKVTDNSGVTASAYVTVTVNAGSGSSGSPVANAGADQTITLPTNSITLTGSGSETNGTIVSYAWSQIGGPSIATNAPVGQSGMKLSGLEQGTYKFELKVTDNTGKSATDYATVTVNPAPSQAPTAIANANQLLTATVSNVTLDGSASYDPVGTIVSYQWLQLSGLGGSMIENATSSVATLTGAKPGVYVFELIVMNNEGATATTTVSVTVNPAFSQGGPVAVAGIDTTISYPATGFVLNGSGSYDPSGTIEAYSWKEVSGPTNALSSTSQGVTAVASGLETGNYVFQLTIIDNNGQSDSSTVAIKVNSTQTEPALSIYPNPTIGEQVNITGTSVGKGNMYVTLLDVSGRMLMKTVYEMEGSAQFSETLPLPALMRGVYLLSIRFDGQNRSKIFKLVRQ